MTQEITSRLAEVMASLIPADKLALVWNSLNREYLAFSLDEFREYVAGNLTAEETTDFIIYHCKNHSLNEVFRTDYHPVRIFVDFTEKAGRHVPTAYQATPWKGSDDMIRRLIDKEIRRVLNEETEEEQREFMDLIYRLTHD